MHNILTPLEPPYGGDLSLVMEKYPRQNGYLLKLFRVFANSVRFASKAVPNLLDKESPLPIREREIVILRTTANTDCEYEWGVHVVIFASAAELSIEQVAATKNGQPDDGIWNVREQALLTVVDDLCRSATISPGSLDLFQQYWSKEQQLEIIALCGTYHTVSFVANAAQVPLEEFGARFPEA